MREGNREAVELRIEYVSAGHAAERRTDENDPPRRLPGRAA